MRKIFFTVFFLIVFIRISAQNYDLDKLTALGIIWGESYLFHPSVIRSDKNLEWEKELVDFLPKISGEITMDEFIQIINSELVSKLADPFTIVQKNNSLPVKEQSKIGANKAYDYLKIHESDFSDISRLAYFNSLITDRNSDKPLVIDVRINGKLYFDYHVHSFMDYFAAMLIEKEIPGNILVSRGHFGWDEYNDWWYYEQQWKVRNTDKAGSTQIEPLSAYMQELQQFIPDFNIENFEPIKRPIYFLTNNSFCSYFNPLMSSLKTYRENLYILNENTGPIFTTENSKSVIYHFDMFDFILNPEFCLHQATADFSTESMTTDKLISFIQSKPVVSKKSHDFTFEITPTVYQNQGKTLSKEEKILGIVKIWTIVKHFYAYPEHCDIDWENSLAGYLGKAQKTSSDKEYFILIQEMMSHLNDSHVNTFHPSILDFSAIFAAPFYFDYIEDKIIVTAVGEDIATLLEVGDEIISIDGKTIPKILKEAKSIVSASNQQGFINTVVNPGYFVGTPESIMKISVKKGDKQCVVELPRTVPVFQIMGMDDNRKASGILDHNIGYLNVTSTQSADELEAGLRQMQNTKSLIIDLRGYPPMWDYNGFLEMLFDKKMTVRIDETPIISAGQQNNKQIQINKNSVNPAAAFGYQNAIVVLIDKSMISRSEDMAIVLKSLPNTTFIGGQTQGTDGEMTKIYLPGGGETSFTGQVVKFGNGKDFQGIGIIPDIQVNRTIKGVTDGRDEILERAIEILNKK